jgi:L-ribulose-5-phosphate 3-epimerase
MPRPYSRRAFLSATGSAAVVLAAPGWRQGREPLFKISLAQWSLHRALGSGQLDHLDFPRVAREEFDLDAVEYVNTFFKTRAKDAAYLEQMNRRARDHGVYQHLIMIDAEGRLGDPDPALRQRAIDNHRAWVDAAAVLGCRTIRVNAESEGSYEEQERLAADGLRRLAEYGDTREINVIVENHGGLSSNGAWLAAVMKRVNHPRCGTLPDFGNFEGYDKYKGVYELMPWAKGVSAKTFDFDDKGEETTLDYRRLMKTVLDAGFRGWIGIEYEGNRLPEREGIAKTKALLEKMRREMASHH